MKVVDSIFALICGWMLNWFAFGFLKSFGIDFGLWRWLLSWVFPLIALVCLWLAYLIGRKILFVFQAAKFFLVGIFATIIDLKFFEILAWLFSSFVGMLIISKAISFLLATFLKYWGNKHWAFQKSEKESIKEIVLFLMVTVIGLALDVSAFYYFLSIMGPQFNLSLHIWTEFSVIFAAIIAAAWNFLGYKFLVFKK